MAWVCVHAYALRACACARAYDKSAMRWEDARTEREDAQEVLVSDRYTIRNDVSKGKGAPRAPEQ